MGLTPTTVDISRRPGKPAIGNETKLSDKLLEKARAEIDAVLNELGSRIDGLNATEADSRLKQYGLNEIAREKRQSPLRRLGDNLKNPLVTLLVALGVLSFLTGDLRATVVIFVMVLLGVVLRFFQEMRADSAAEKLQAMVSNTATVARAGAEIEVALKLLVPGDIIRLAAGDMAPADARVLLAKDLFLNQATLTGEALPVERKAGPLPAEVQNPLELSNLCFLGSNVVSGSATAVVIHSAPSLLSPKPWHENDQSPYLLPAFRSTPQFLLQCQARRQTSPASAHRSAFLDCAPRIFSRTRRMSALPPAGAATWADGVLETDFQDPARPARSRTHVRCALRDEWCAALSGAFPVDAAGARCRSCPAASDWLNSHAPIRGPPPPD